LEVLFAEAEEEVVVVVVVAKLPQWEKVHPSFAIQENQLRSNESHHLVHRRLVILK